MARSPNHAQPGDEEGSVLVTNFPTAHGNHFHVGDAVVLASDAGGLGNPNVLAILERKGLLRSLHPMGALLTAEALAYDTGLADQVLHRPDHRSEERRVGKECVSTCRSRWSPDHKKKNVHINKYKTN